MTDLLARLALRSQGEPGAIRPRVPSLFEPQRRESGGVGARPVGEDGFEAAAAGRIRPVERDSEIELHLEQPSEGRMKRPEPEREQNSRGGPASLVPNRSEALPPRSLTGTLAGANAGLSLRPADRPADVAAGGILAEAGATKWTVPERLPISDSRPVPLPDAVGLEESRASRRPVGLASSRVAAEPSAGRRVEEMRPRNGPEPGQVEARIPALEELRESLRPGSLRRAEIKAGPEAEPILRERSSPRESVGLNPPGLPALEGEQRLLQTEPSAPQPVPALPMPIARERGEAAGLIRPVASRGGKLAASLQASPASEPSIRVTIGRVEVRAVMPPAPPARNTAPRSRPTVSLDEYLKRSGAGR
jgi:hypothetical protein